MSTSGLMNINPCVHPRRGLLFLSMILSPLSLLPAALTHVSTRLGQDMMSLAPFSPWGVFGLVLLLPVCIHKPMWSHKFTMDSHTTAPNG